MAMSGAAMLEIVTDDSKALAKRARLPIATFGQQALAGQTLTKVPASSLLQVFKDATTTT
jgi:hypothetical protein